jgi:hypothetical protein
MVPTGPTRLTTALAIVVAFLKVYFTGSEFRVRGALASPVESRGLEGYRRSPCAVAAKIALYYKVTYGKVV